MYYKKMMRGGRKQTAKKRIFPREGHEKIAAGSSDVKEETSLKFMMDGAEFVPCGENFSRS